MAQRFFPNGLRLGITESSSEKLVCVAVHIIGGSQSETNYQSGVGEFLARLLLCGTQNNPSKQMIERRAKRDGIILESSCKAENILLSCTCPKEKLESAIDLLHEILFTSLFDSAAADEVRNHQLADIFSLNESPSYILSKLTNNVMFLRTGLANPRFGTATTIERMRAVDAKEFLTKILTPKNTVISVAGNVDGDEVYDLVMRKFYTSFMEHTEYKKLKYVAHVDNVKQNVITRNKKLNQSRILLSFPCNDYRYIKRHALSIALPILLGNMQKELSNLEYFHTESIDMKRFAYNGRLSFELVVDGEHALEYVKKVINFLETRGNIVSEEEFELEKNIYSTKLIEEYDDVKNLAEKQAKEIAINKQSFSVSSELLNVSMMHNEDAIKLLSEILDKKALTCVYLGSPLKEDVLESAINQNNQ